MLNVDQLSTIQAQLAAITDQLAQQAQRGPTLGQMVFMEAQTSMSEQAFDFEDLRYLNNS